MKNNNENNRRYFSIAKEFNDVKKILDNTHNASRFICEAVREKNEKDIKRDISLETQVLDILVKLVATNQLTQLLLNQNSPLPNNPPDYLVPPTDSLDNGYQVLTSSNPPTLTLEEPLIDEEKEKMRAEVQNLTWLKS